MSNFGSGGAMFVRQKKSPKAADYSGDFTLEGDVLDYVLREAERGNPVKLEIAGWKRQGRNNSVFISLNVQTPYSERGGQQPQQGFKQGRGSYNQGDGSGRYREQIPTSRGQYQRDYPQQGQGQGRQGYARNERFRQELNDDIPDFGGNDRNAPF